MYVCLGLTLGTLCVIMCLLKGKSQEFYKRRKNKAIAEIEHFQTYKRTTEDYSIQNQIQNDLDQDLTDDEETVYTSEDMYANNDATADEEIKDKEFFNLAKFMDDDVLQNDDVVVDQLEKPNREFIGKDNNLQ